MTHWQETLHSRIESPDVNAYYDNNHYVQICTEVNTIMDYRLDVTDAVMGDGPFSVEEIAVEVRKLKLGKKGGNDSLTNEHIKYGGPVLCESLAKLRGLIVTLYKGSRKYENDRKNIVVSHCFLLLPNYLTRCY